MNVFEENIAALDGTNACSFLAMKIVDTPTTSDFGAFRDVSTNLKGAVENIISTLTRKINRLRNINDHLSVEEAYNVHTRYCLKTRGSKRQTQTTQSSLSTGNRFRREAIA